MARPASVPFMDLGPSHKGLKQELLDAIGELVDQGAFTNGPQVRAFEQAFSAYCGASACVGLASGLDALRLALIAAGIERGDEVIVPAMTFVATIEAVVQAGGRPVFVDVGEADYCLDVESVSAVVGSRTRFVLPVHLYGQMADMRAVERLATKHDLHVVEDACQAHGAARDGVRAGSRWSGRSVQFLSREEPWSFRRCRCANHRRRTHCRTRTRTARARTTREVSPRIRGIHRSPRHHPGARAPAQAAAPPPLERAEARGGGALQRGALGNRRSPATARPAGQ